VRRTGKQGRQEGKDRKPAKASAASVAAAAAPSVPRAGEAGNAGSDAADQISFSNLSLHELFEQQARTMLESADLDEEQKQSILVAMACPCCGAGGMSFSVKLKR
jgi:hypothetical protein